MNPSDFSEFRGSLTHFLALIDHNTPEKERCSPLNTFFFRPGDNKSFFANQLIKKIKKTKNGIFTQMMNNNNKEHILTNDVEKRSINHQQVNKSEPS